MDYEALARNIEEVCEDVFKRKPSIQIINSTNSEEKLISVDDTWEILVGEVECDTLWGKEKKDCWEIYFVYVISNYPHAPDDADPVFVSKHQKDDDLVVALITAMAKERAGIFIDNRAQYLAWEEEQEDLKILEAEEEMIRRECIEYEANRKI